MTVVDLIDETESVEQAHLDLVEQIILFASDYLKLSENTELAVSFVDDKRIQEINRDFRNIDKATDVISFALNDNSKEDDFPILDLPDELTNNIGDIIISIDKAKEQAEDYGHTYERELGFLALHGFLHLNGYDHMEKEDEAEMFSLQKEILDAYGLKRDE